MFFSSSTTSTGKGRVMAGRRKPRTSSLEPRTSNDDASAIRFEVRGSRFEVRCFRFVSSLPGLAGGCRCRKAYDETGAFSKLRFGPDGPGVKLDIVFNDREAEAGALFLGGIVGVEDFLQLVHGNARSGVAHGDFQRLIGATRGGDGDFAPAL